MITGSGIDTEERVIVSVNGTNLKEVETFIYLGIIERPDNSMESELNAKKRAMTCAFSNRHPYL